jgi:hypothetical protein
LAGAAAGSLTARDLLPPQLGFNTIFALEYGGPGVSFKGNGQQMLTMSLDM